MNLLKYSNTIEKKIHGNSDLYIDSLMKKIQEKLRNIEIQSEITNDTIIFKKSVKIYSREEALKPLRKGQFRIKKINSNKIEIFWEVELDILLFLAIAIGLVLGLILGLFAESAGLMVVFSIIIGVIFSTLTYLFGLNSILTTIDEILGPSI